MVGRYEGFFIGDDGLRDNGVLSFDRQKQRAIRLLFISNYRYDSASFLPRHASRSLAILPSAPFSTTKDFYVGRLADVGCGYRYSLVSRTGTHRGKGRVESAHTF